MKTNLYLAAALGLASLHSALADAYTVMFVPGFNAIANQLNNGDNTLATIFGSQLPTGSQIHKWNVAGQTYHPGALYSSKSGWTINYTLIPGEGAFLQLPPSVGTNGLTFQFNGTPNLPVLPVSLASGAWYFLSRQTNDVGTFENIVGTPPVEGTEFDQWDKNLQAYRTNQFIGGAWLAGPPALAVGESAFFRIRTNVPPVITAQPQGRTNFLGTTATFSVGAGGTPPLSYQWYFDGTSLVPGETNNALVLANVQFAQEGDYRVVITNAFGAVTSAPAYLEVLSGAADLNGFVVAVDSQGRPRGLLAGASVEVLGVGITNTDAQGRFRFRGLSAGSNVVTATAPGYIGLPQVVNLRSNDVLRDVKLQVAQLSPDGNPTAFNVASPNGRNFIPAPVGPPPPLISFTTAILWNGPSGYVMFNVGGLRALASIDPVPGVPGAAFASASIPMPTNLVTCIELTIVVVNGNNHTNFLNAGIRFHPIPNIIVPWYRDNIPWNLSGLVWTFAREDSWQPLKLKVPPFLASPIYELNAGFSLKRGISYDLLAGKFSGEISGAGKVTQKADVDGIEIIGEGALGVGAKLEIDFSGCDDPRVTPGWKVFFNGKQGVKLPIAVVVQLIPPAAPVVVGLRKVPGVRSLVDAVKLGVFKTYGLELSGEYANQAQGNCFLGTTGLKFNGTLGLEVSASVGVGGAELTLYGGGSGTPEFLLCPEFKFDSMTFRAYVGVSASAWVFSRSYEVGTELKFDSGGGALVHTAARALAESPADLIWQPIANQRLRWGEANRLAGGSLKSPASTSSAQAPDAAACPVENVTTLAAPCVLVTAPETLVLFSLHDPAKPWHAATDIGTLRETGGNTWIPGRIADDLAADFSPKAINLDSNTVLATWEQIVGDVSGTTNPVEVVPHLEIMTARYDRSAGTWSVPQALTTNAVVDRAPLPVTFGQTQGIVWIQNAGAAVVGDSTNRDHLLFSAWASGAWQPAQELWSAPKGILQLAFVADADGEGHIAFAVDEDGNPDTQSDRELYQLATSSGVWQPAVRVTNDGVEDALPTLVAANGVPLCVWATNGTLVYSPLMPWNPKLLYPGPTLAAEAPTLAGVTLPGGAGVAYATHTPTGADIFASFYDPALDVWTLPRQLTSNEHVESALSVAADGNDLVIAFLKTLTERTNLDVEINGQLTHLENVPRPGRTDLCLLRHTPGYDLAVATDSLSVDPPNPVPGSNALLRAVVENLGDRPVSNFQIAFYDGNPASGGTLIGSTQTITGLLIGGATQEVSAAWTVPAGAQPHELFVTVDPASAINDRDRLNNAATRRAVLPDLTIERIWNEEVSASTVALLARIVNAGVLPSAATEVSWRLGSANGEELGRNSIASLNPGQALEVSYFWDSAGRSFPGGYAPVFAVVDATNAVQEFNETNNQYSASVSVVASWVPRILAIEVLPGGTRRLTFEAANSTASEWVVETTPSLAHPITWEVDNSATILLISPGEFEVHLPPQGDVRFYRIRTSP